MEILQLEYFIAVCDTGSFTAAAKACFTSRQNLTRTVKHLEREVGVQLLSRENNRTVPTLAGREALWHARLIVDEVRFLEGAFPTPATDTGLRVLLATNTSTFLPHEIFSGNILDGAHVSEYTPSECHRKVVSGDADIAIVISMSEKFANCISTTIDEQKLHFLVSVHSPLALRESIEVADLNGYELCLLPDREFVYSKFLDKCRVLRLDETMFNTIGSTGLAKAAIRLRGAVATVPSSFDADDMYGITAVPCGDAEMTLTTSCLYRARSANTSRIVNFIAELKKLYCS